MKGCVFCARIEAGSFAYAFTHAVAFEPLRPVTRGHLLVVPRVHVADFASNPLVTAMTASVAAQLAADLGDCNLITSRGTDATQTVFHLHLHLVPRRMGDGLELPWTGQA